MGGKTHGLSMRLRTDDGFPCKIVHIKNDIHLVLHMVIFDSLFLCHVLAHVPLANMERQCLAMLPENGYMSRVTKGIHI